MSAKLLLVVLVGLIAALEVSCGKKYVIDGLDDVYESPDPIEAPEGAASGAGELKIEGPDDILNFVEIDDQWFYTTRNALLSLEIPANVEITKEVLEKAFDEAAKKNVRFELVKRTLLNLNEWRDCSSEVADSFLPILRLKELQRFRNFFESYWWEKFRKCEKRTTPLVIRDLNGISAYKALKDFLNAAMDLQEDIEAPALSDAEYYATLRDVDLNDGKYKNKASMAVAKKYKRDWEQWDAKGNSVEVDDDVKYVKFLTKKCYLAFNNQHTQFAIINLTKRFEQANGADLESNGMPCNILNEWRRICLGWLKGGDDERKALMAKSIDEKLRGPPLSIRVYDANRPEREDLIE